LRKESQRIAIENSHVNNVFSNASEVIVIVTLSLTKNFARVAVSGFFPVLKVLLFDAGGVPDEVVPF